MPESRSMAITPEVREAWKRLTGVALTPESIRDHWGKAVTFDELRRVRDRIMGERATDDALA
jgi:hypothetical protein